MNELQALDELDFFGRIEVKMSEGGVSSRSETLQMFYGLNQSAGRETKTKIAKLKGVEIKKKRIPRTMTTNLKAINCVSNSFLMSSEFR